MMASIGDADFQRLATVLACLAVVVPSLTASGQGAALPASAPGLDSRSRLVFTPAGPGEFQFDTGVLRGRLRPGGKARGLSSVVHVPTGIPLDRGDKGYGLFSHYRVFTTGKRYGTGAWDWLGEGRLLPDGAVETRWPAAMGRPFEMRAIYRWSAPATLDLETIVTAQTNLARFESFLASYFAAPFTNALALLADHPTGSRKPGLIEADRLFGDWLMFPRDNAIVALINDGRWRLEPNPVDWTIMPRLAKPVVVRRAPQSGLTAVLMAPPADCFAVAMPYQTEGHLSTYLSLFGRDVKAGETVRAHSRLVVGMGLAEPQIVELNRSYLAELRGSR